MRRERRIGIIISVVLGIDVTGTNGLVWDKRGTTDSKFEDRLSAGTESKRIRPDNSGTYIHFGGGVKMNARRRRPATPAGGCSG